MDNLNKISALIIIPFQLFLIFECGLLFSESLPHKLPNKYLLYIIIFVLMIIFVLQIRSLLLSFLRSSEFRGENYSYSDDNDQEIRNCDNCKMIKFKRVHHCSVCNKYGYYIILNNYIH